MNGKKNPCIPRLYPNNKFISETKAKCDLFNLYFAGQCTPLVRSSQLPTRLTNHIDSVLTSIDFSIEQVSNIIKKLDPNKVHGHDKISIGMLKLCQDSTNRPFANMFKNCFNKRIKNDKQIVTNCLPVSPVTVGSYSFTVQCINIVR